MFVFSYLIGYLGSIGNFGKKLLNAHLRNIGNFPLVSSHLRNLGSNALEEERTMII